MEHGFFRAACATPEVAVADTESNASALVEAAREAAQKGARMVVFPELCLTGYTCSDLFLQDSLQSSALSALERVAEETRELEILIFAGLPLFVGNALYNVAAAILGGKILAIVPKSFMPNYAEFYERRQFSPFDPERCRERSVFISEKNPEVPFGTDILIQDENFGFLKVAVEICEDLWVPLSPSTMACLSGASVVANLSASNETIAKSGYRRDLCRIQSAKGVCAYLYANAGGGESTTDLVFSGHSLICENGVVLCENQLFSGEMIFADIDLDRIRHERLRTTTFSDCSQKFSGEFRIVKAKILGSGKSRLGKAEGSTRGLFRRIPRTPFVPEDGFERSERCRAVLELQARGLTKRLLHTKAASAVIGLSGGLDSTLALIATCRAFDICNIPRERILCVTMPCFGTTDRTYQNALSLARETGASLREVRISDAVLQHFSDIGQDPENRDVTYENSQARERTQVLMDLANKTGGLVIGTGDLSEQALGWATYNGDHMSMYGVNGSIPKTLVRHLVKWFSDDARKKGGGALSAVLDDILATPVSPELLPPDGSDIAQKTEDLVGPYELHDFFLYYVLRFGFSPRKIFFLAEQAFIVQGEGEAYGRAEIRKWLVSFYRRFFSQQFKRSCMPDGAKVGSVNLSPRGDWRMPSDASGAVWLKEAEGISV